MPPWAYLTSSTDPAAINHEALTYAHAAAAVRGCSFPLHPNMSPALLQQLLPFCGAFTARIITQVLTTGTCEPLERYKANQPVLNSRGEVRPNTAGGSTRSLFTRLPGVGPGLALSWFEAGCSTIEDVLQLVQPAHIPDAADSTAGQHLPVITPAATASAQTPRFDTSDTSSTIVLGTPAWTEAAPAVCGGAGVGAMPAAGAQVASTAAAQAAGSGPVGAANGPPVNISKEALYSLQHSADLLEPVSSSDIHEMKGVVLQGMNDITAGGSAGGGDGWRIELVGGGRRSRSVHDADFLVTHPTMDLEGLVLRLYRWLVSRGRMVPREQAFVRLQQGRMVGYKARARNDIIAKRWSDKQQMDSYDHVWGIFITAAGRRRRMDVMIVPPSMWPFAVLGWSGSKQYLRFLRHHAGNCGMNLNSHGLFRMVEVPRQLPARAAAAGTTPETDEASNTGSMLLQGTTTDNSRGAGSSSLAEAIQYVSTSAAAGMTKAVLAVPDEAPPLNRDLQESWPPDWDPAGAASTSDAPATAAEGGPGAAHGGTSSSGGAGAASDAAAVHQQQATMASLVQAGGGCSRVVVDEPDICELLGVPFRVPSERCC